MKDADNYAEYCLECVRKHLDTAFKNLGEIEQRLIYKPEPDKKVRLKVEDIIADLSAAENHTLDNTQASKKEKIVLATITDSLRKTRKLLETTKLGYRDERIVPVGGLTDIQLAKQLVDKQRGQVHSAIAEIGCGDCDKVEAQMSLVTMRKELKKEVQEPIVIVAIHTEPELSLLEEEVQVAAKECKKVEEPEVCVTDYAVKTQAKLEAAKQKVIPTTTQIIEQIHLEMKK